ncbi:MAG: DUF262 domain-containing protein [Ktedonobacteraceae bacterium]
MKAVENQFLTFLNGKKQFIIPIYQRTYSWTREQGEQLWNDIVRTASDKEVTSHFVGSIVYIQHGLFMAGGVMPLLVIDGQQRLTTLSLLLIALAKAARDSTVPLGMSHEDIYDSYLINKYSRDEQRYKLLLTQGDKDTLIALTDDPDRAKLILPANRLLENYLYFENRIRQGSVDPFTLYAGISKLMIVEISLNKAHDDPQLIFESLNSTGMDLSQADLIRNYVLMGLDNEEQTKLYKTYWYPMEQSFRHTDDTYQFDRFMRDYLTIKQGSIPNIDEVYGNFKTYQRSKTAAPISELVADIDRYARYFVKMAFLKEEDHEIRRVLYDINTLKVDVAYPFLLEVYDDYAHKLLSREDFIAILRLVESYVFRRVICGVPTNSMNKTFATLAREIDKEQYLESVQAAFLQKDAYRRFPRDEEFRAAFMVKDVYNFRSRNYMLRKLENSGSKEWVNIEDYTIEHILPQNERLSSEWQVELGSNWKEVHARYLHTIGNLTLTGYNSELSDRPFREKRDMKGGFAKSPIHLNESLTDVERWNEEEIQKRAGALADVAVTVWSMPQLTSEQVSRIARQAQKGSLTEVIGPIDHPHAGFIPEGFKILQIKENRFHYFRQVAGEWVQYGNGKDAWYAISWDTVGRWLRDFDKKNTMPLGVGRTVAQQYVKFDTASNGYSLEGHLGYMPVDIRGIFERLRKRILNLDSSVKEEARKLYIAYKTTTDFVDIEPQKKRLLVILNVRWGEIDDPGGLCRNVMHIGHDGNGEVEVSIDSFDEIEDVMDLIRQAFEKHSEEVVAG